MAKRQHRDSVQERAAERLDNRKQGERAPKKEKVLRTYKEVSTRELKIGSKIATHVNERRRTALSFIEVKELEYGRGCHGVHINKSMCYDLAGLVLIVTGEYATSGEYMLPDGSYGSEVDLLEAVGIA